MTTISRIFYLLLLISCFSISCKKDKVTTNIEDNFYIRNGGSDMPVWVHGNAASKVFIVTMHGGPGIGYGLDFKRGIYSESLEKKYAMVYWDQRHQGSAHGHLKNEEMTVDLIVEDIHFLHNTLKKKYGEDISLFLMGHSWGGTATTAFMITKDYQYDIKGWINIAGTPDLVDESIFTLKYIKTIANDNIAKGTSTTEWQDILNMVSDIDTNTIVAGTDDYNSLFKAEKKASSLVKSSIYPLKYRDGQGDFESILLSPAPSPDLIFGNTIQLVIQGFYKAIQKNPMSKDLHKITTPTLLVFGKHDLGTPPTVGEVILNGLGTNHKFLEVYSNSGHEPFGTEPDFFVEHMTNFIELYK